MTRSTRIEIDPFLPQVEFRGQVPLDPRPTVGFPSRMTGFVTAAACTNHPAREAVGICVRCRTRVCSECTTKVEGINYCVACLAELAAAGQDGHGASGGRRAGRGVLSAGFHLALLMSLLYVLLEVMLPGASR
ncbi:MAG: hypothetical protein OXU20_37565 [Myxococcales bacterium]|nr:hypothetical protein [Myxococcales bacterium]MDD9964974.1 hypothetical protein [Myxococcales bacterium]